MPGPVPLFLFLPRFQQRRRAGDERFVVPVDLGRDLFQRPVVQRRAGCVGDAVVEETPCLPVEGD